MEIGIVCLYRVAISSDQCNHRHRSDNRAQFIVLQFLSTVSLLSAVYVVGDCHPQSVNECPSVSNQLARPLDRLQLCDGTSPLSDLYVHVYDLRKWSIFLVYPKHTLVLFV